MRLSRKQMILIALVAGVALYFLLRKKKPSTMGTILDPSNDAQMSALYDQLNGAG